jgi:hypothetical protein
MFWISLFIGDFRLSARASGRLFTFGAYARELNHFSNLFVAHATLRGPEK